MPTFTVPSDFASMPAKDFLRKYAGVSLTLWRKIKRHNQFFINGVQAMPALAQVCAGDAISYDILIESSIHPADLPLRIAYEDESLLVLDKPAGQLVHPTTKEHHGTLANAILGYYASQNLPYAFHPVHRLDKNTSGLILIAKMPQIQHQLTVNFKNFGRVYQAITSGYIYPAQGTICASIARRPGSIIERMVSPEGQSAVTHYKTLHAGCHFSLLELALETGRTHQIRVHLSHIGHPLLGDDLYGGSTKYISRQALHANNLHFIHPISGKSFSVSSKLPNDMVNLLRGFSC